MLMAEMVARGKSRGLIKHVVAPIRGVFNEAIEAGLQLPNPAARIGRFLRGRGDPAHQSAHRRGGGAASRDSAALVSAPLFPAALCAADRDASRRAPGASMGRYRLPARFIEVRRSLVEGGRIELPKNGKIRRVDLSLLLGETLEKLRVRRSRRWRPWRRSRRATRRNPRATWSPPNTRAGSRIAP